MATRNTRSLVLDISADVTKLASGSKVARSAMLELQRGAESVEAAVQKSMADLMPVESARRAEAELDRIFRSVKANARAVLSEADPKAALQLFDVGAADQQVVKLRETAGALRQQSEAFELASKEGGEFAARQQQIAVALKTEAVELEQQALALDETASAFRGIQAASGAHATGMRRTTQMSGEARAGLQQLSFQLNDVSLQYAAGTPPMTIFAQQSGQVVQALGMVTRGAKGLLGFLGGPWGMIMASAAVVLAPLVAKLWEADEAAEESEQSQRSLTEVLADEKSSYEEVTKALREYNREQDKSREITLQALTAQAEKIKANYDEAISHREKLRVLLEEQANAQQIEQRATGVTGGLGAQEVARTEADIAKQDALIRDLQESSRKTSIEIAREIAKINTDAAAKIKLGFDVLRKEAEGGLSGGALTDRLTALNRAEQRALEAERQSSRAGSSSTGGSAARVGDMTALIQQLFPGARITSTTGGRHTKGSDHYAGRAIDFVPAGGMGSISTAEVQRRLEEAGVDIRRNANGTEQLFGPGRPASRPGDHDDHFHLAWEGNVDPERAAEAMAREQERAAKELADRTRRSEQLVDQAQGGILGALMSRAETEDQRLNIQLLMLKGEREAQERALDLQVEGGDIDAARAEEAKNLWRAADQLEIQALQREAQQRQLDEQLRGETEALNRQSALLRLQQGFAGTLEERRRIALQLLDLDLQERRLAAQRLLQSPDARDRARGKAELAQIDVEEPLLREGVRRDNAGPIESYVQRLRDATSDMDTAFDEVAASGLANLEDGLVGVISGTESVGSAFKRMANQIIADLARIAVRKMILNQLGGFLGFSGGGVVGGDPTSGWGMPGLYAGGGMISGPGSGTSDSIPALLSNGEFVINAASTARFRPLLEAINEGRLPGFAAGGLVAPSAARLARLPELSRLSRGGGEPQERLQVDVRARVDAGPMFDVRMEEVSARTVSAAAEPIMAGAEARTRRNLERPRLPGGYG